MHAVFKGKPSDSGLQYVAGKVGVWDELAISLGVPEVKIEEYRHQALSNVKSLSYWRNGSTGNPVTWEFLLEKVQELPDLGPMAAENIKKKVIAHPDWTWTEDAGIGIIISFKESDANDVNGPLP